MVRAAILAALMLLAGCGGNPPQQCEPEIRTVEVKVPYREVRTPPEHLAEAYVPEDLPEWVQPAGSGLICLAPEEFNVLQNIILDHISRDEQWRQWADVGNDSEGEPGE